MAEWQLLLLLFFCGAVAFSISTLTAGGGALMLIPILNLLIGVTATAPVLNAANLFGRPTRLVLFWKSIVWKAVWWYAPFALIGSILAAAFFSNVRIPILQVIVGLFLISTVFQYGWGKKKASFYMSYPLLAPLGLVISIIGTLIGGAGPVLNPFYLNLDISKEELIATKTANSFMMGLAQIGSYSVFGLLDQSQWTMSIALGLGIAVGNLFGKKLLGKITDQSFRKWAIGFMVLSGVLLLLRVIFQSG